MSREFTNLSDEELLKIGELLVEETEGQGTLVAKLEPSIYWKVVHNFPSDNSEWGESDDTEIQKRSLAHLTHTIACLYANRVDISTLEAFLWAIDVEVGLHGTTWQEVKKRVDEIAEETEPIQVPKPHEKMED